MRVFVSHAAPDKRLVRPLVDALLSEGAEVFIDRPREFGYSASDLRRFKIRYLQSGEAYDGELLDELRECDAVLGCLSVHLTPERVMLTSELTVAHFSRRLVTCLLGDVAPETLPERLGLFRAATSQSYRVDSARLAAAVKMRARGRSLSAEEAEEWSRFEFILHELQERAAAAEARDDVAELAAAGDRIDPSAMAGVLLRTPRKRQVREVERVLARAQSGGAHPLIVAGPENEAVAEFVDAIPEMWVAARREGTRPHVLEQIDLSFDADDAEVDYDLKRALARHLPFGDRVDFSRDRPFADALSLRFPSVILCVASPMHVERVAEALDAVSRWLAFWARIEAAGANPKPKLAPVLPLIMDPARPGWDISRKGPIEDPFPRAGGALSWLWAWGGCVNHRAHRGLRALENRSRKESSEGQPLLAPATYLPLLNPVRVEEADGHLCAELPTLARPRRAALEAIFPQRGAQAPGLPMARYMDGAMTVLEGEAT